MSWHYLSLPTSFSVTLVQLTALTDVFMLSRMKFHFPSSGKAICGDRVSLAVSGVPGRSLVDVWCGGSIVSYFLVTPKDVGTRHLYHPQHHVWVAPPPSKLNLWFGLPTGWYPMVVFLLVSGCDNLALRSVFHGAVWARILADGWVFPELPVGRQGWCGGWEVRKSRPSLGTMTWRRAAQFASVSLPVLFWSILFIAILFSDQNVTSLVLI